MHPAAFEPKIPDSLVCLHGIALSRDDLRYMLGSMISRIDYRRQTDNPNLSREAMYMPHRTSNTQIDKEIQCSWEEILQQHLATTQWTRSKDSWKYKQELVDDFPIYSFWGSVDGLIPIHMDGQQRLKSLAFVQDIPILGTTIQAQSMLYHYDRRKKGVTKTEPVWDSNTPFITESNLIYLSNEHRNEIFRNRKIINIRWLKIFARAYARPLSTSDGNNQRYVHTSKCSLHS